LCAATPAVTGTLPRSGPVSGGVAVYVSGSDLRNTTLCVVRFMQGSQSVVVTPAVVNATLLSLLLPALPAAGDYFVSFSLDGQVFSTLNANFTAYGTLTIGFQSILSVSRGRHTVPFDVHTAAPAYGPVSGGTLVTVTGTNFTSFSSGDVLVKFVTAAGDSVVSGTVTTSSAVVCVASAVAVPQLVSVLVAQNGVNFYGAATANFSYYGMQFFNCCLTV
jgi:hypothetical protein